MTYKKINKAIQSVGAPLGAQWLTKVPAMECAPEGAPTDRVKCIYTRASALNW